MPELFPRPVKRLAAGLVSGSLILLSPGLEAWAAAGKMFSGTPAPAGVSLPSAPLAPVTPGLSMPAAPQAGVPVAALPGIPALPSAPSAAPAAALPGAPAAPAAAPHAATPRAAPAASLSGPSGPQGGPAAAPGGAGSNAAQPSAEQGASEGARRFDHAAAADRPAADAVEAPEWTSPIPSDLKLKPADARSVSQWMADFHAKTAQDYPQYEFTVRDFYAWARFVRFYTPSLGIKEAVTRGAAYVYRDRFENQAEAQAFEAALGPAARSLAVSDPAHGKDAGLARELLALAEPAPPALHDESSPYQVPVSALVPDAKANDLVMTATTLKRVEAASQAFALRDFALLVGPPATEKSAIPKYLASQHKIPYLAVTMHPGVGVFELVGGYRPRVARAGTLRDAAAAVGSKLAKDEASGDYNDLLEAAAKVYGARPMADVLAAVRADLAGPALETLAETERARRLTTLAYALQHGAQSLVWQDGYLTYAIKNDIWITFEELNAAPTETQEFLNEFMRSRRLAVTQKLGETEVLSPRPGGRFMLWATMNPETDSNREVLAQTLKNRWRIKYFGHLPAIETAEIIEKKFGMPTVWALSLVENFHRELDRQARERVIGGSWRDGYEINLRQLLRTARRWRYFVDQEAGAGKSGGVPEARQRLLLAREAYSLYGGMMRTANERAGVFRMLDQALGLHAAGVRSADDLTVRPTAIEDLGDSIRIGDVTLPKGPGGPFVPKPNKDYLADAVVLGRLYEYAKALALGEPLLLMGDSAAGKTSDLEYLFFRLNRNLRYKNLDSDTAIEEVIGGFAPGDRKGTFTFQEGMIPKAMEEGTGAFLDEFNLNPLVEWLNTVIDDGKLYLPHRIVDGRAMIVAAANPPDPRYPGRVLLSAATRSRYTERWVDIDKSPARLTDLMSHWLKGGAVYGLLAVTLPSLHAVLSGLNGGGMGSFALGRYQKQEGFPWMLLGVAGTAYFFAAAAAHFGNPIGFFAAIAAVWTGIIMSDKAKRRDAGKPLAAADLKELQRLVDARGWQGTHWSRVLDDNHATRALGIDSLGQRPFDDDTARMLEILARAETTAGNVSRAIKTLGDNESSEAIPALERLKTALPPEFASQVAAALAHARSRRLEAPSGELANLAVSPAAPTRAQDAFSRAASAAAALQAKGDLASRLRAKALTEKAAELSAADGDANQSAILLRQLEDLLAAPVGGDGGSAAAGRSWLSRLKGAFGSKKKAPEAVDRGASAPSGDDEAPARAPTLEELLRARGVPEKDWPSVRAKVDRVQTIIQMVGGSVGRDGSTRWAPGDLWAFFPDENTVTYPFEDLLTHSEEELVGLTDHEGGHRDITVLDQRLPLVKKYFGDPVKHFLWNGFEDPRVNNWDIKRMPGAARYLHAAYDRYLPEDLEARPTNDAPDLSSPQGDGASAFSPEALQYPHIEFVMAGNYYWRYGKKPPKFHNKSAEKAFDQALPEIEKIFRNYPQRTDPDQKERAAYSYDTLKRIDETLLPLYEPLVAESQKKMARQMSGKGKDGKGQGQSQNGKGKSGAGAMPPQEQKGQSKPDPNGKDKKPGDAKDQSKDPQGEPLDPQALKEALEKLQEHARKAAEELGGKIEEKPTNKDIREALKKKGLTPGSEAPKPLTLQDIAQTQREQLVNRQASAFDRAFAPVAHLSGAMVTHLENIFLKNSRPRDEGWYRTGKRPDVKQFMKRQGEGGLRDDYMLRRAARTKRKYKVTLLIDASGSMAAHAVETSRTAVLLAESLTRLQIDVEIILFSNVARVVKSFEQPMTPQNRDAIAEDFRALIGSLGNGMTHDADALTQSLERLRAQDGDRKFVFVVTDGAGNGPSKLSDALAQAARDQVFVMGVGIGAGMETYVKANYPRHATVSTVDELPLKLKQELERYISEQELSPRARASLVPQGQGTDPGSRALGRPYPSLALQALSVAVAAGFAVGLLGLMALAPWPVGLFIGSPLTGLLLLWSRGRGFWLVEAAYLTAAATVFYLLMGHSGRFSALWAALIIGPAALKMFGHRLAGRYAPLEPALKAEVRAALAGTRGAEGLYGWRPARLKALDAVSGAKAGLFTKPLALLAERDPAEDVRLRAVEILSHHAAADDEALEALRRAARAGGEAGALARRRLDAALKTRAETAAKTIDLETLTAPAAPSRAEDSAETRARAFLASAEDGGLAGRLRREAVAEALRQLEAAKAAGGGDESVVAERRLRDLLDAGASGGAAGSQALPAPRGGWRLFLERRLPTSFVAWLGVMKWSLGFTTGAWALAALVPGLKALQGVLLIGGLFGIFGPGKGPRSHIIARAGIFAFLVSMFLTAPVMGSGMGWVVWGCFNMLAAVGTVEKTLPGIVERWGAPNRMARWAILRSGTKGLSPRQRWWRRALAGSARARDAAAAEMLAAPSEVPGVQAPLLALSSHAADKMTPELVEVLVRLRTPEADSALTILSMMKAAPASKWAQEALARRAAAESAPLPQLLEPAKPDADARTLSAARAELEKPAETLSARLRAQALTEAVTAVEGSSGDERRLALERLRALLEDPAGDAGGAAASGGAPRLRLPLWSALGAAALALGLAAGPAIAALVALSPLAAAGAGAAGGALVARSLSRPLDFRDARAAVGPREISRDIPEWARAQRALLRLTARLGAAPEQAPSLALWSDEPGSARPSWDGWSGGVGVNARSVVAVGERWLTAAELELEGLIAHELGHLATGELRWRALWSRLHRAARWAALAAPALIPVAGWLWPALAAAAWAASGLLGLAFLRRAELRADKFAAKLAGPDAARAFLARLAAEAPETPGVSGRLLSLFSDHPTLERRRAALGKPPR